MGYPIDRFSLHLQQKHIYTLSITPPKKAINHIQYNPSLYLFFFFFYYQATLSRSPLLYTT